MDAGVGVVLPEWVQILVASIIATVGGIAGIMGWRTGKNTQPQGQAEIMGAVVDSRSVKALSDVIDFQVDRVVNLHDERLRHDKNVIEESEATRRELRKLNKNIERLLEAKGVLDGQ